MCKEISPDKFTVGEIRMYKIKGKGKGKVHPRTSHDGSKRE
jgi:hypothetical protein